jgi:hypothetical protein
MAACVVQDAASATGARMPEHATKQTGRARRPNLNLKLDPKDITAAFQFGC